MQLIASSLWETIRQLIGQISSRDGLRTNTSTKALQKLPPFRELTLRSRCLDLNLKPKKTKKRLWDRFVASLRLQHVFAVLIKTGRSWNALSLRVVSANRVAIVIAVHERLSCSFRDTGEQFLRTSVASVNQYLQNQSLLCQCRKD